jgi:hypothetical protein
MQAQVRVLSHTAQQPSVRRLWTLPDARLAFASDTQVMMKRARHTVMFARRHDPTSPPGAQIHVATDRDHSRSRTAGAYGSRSRIEPLGHANAMPAGTAKVHEAPGCFAYEYTDIPPDVTLRQWRRAQPSQPTFWTRMHSRLSWSRFRRPRG